MASEFAEDFSGFPAIHFSGSFPGLDAADMEDSGSLGLAGYSGYGFSEALLNDLPVFLPVQCPVQDPIPLIQAGKRRKSVTVSRGAAAPGSVASAGAKTKRKDSSRRGGRRGRCCGEEEEEEVEMKTKEVVHVRAKRGQATDSHSLAERLRREKINEKMRCLQDLVPGCYKAMGTAVLLDEIINYVQSLQNQIEFLSMKLSAASAVNDFKSDAEAAAARWLARSVLRCPSTSSGDGVPGWDQAAPPSADTASGEIFLQDPFPLSISVHQFPQWDGQ